MAKRKTRQGKERKAEKEMMAVRPKATGLSLRPPTQRDLDLLLSFFLFNLSLGLSTHRGIASSAARLAVTCSCAESVQHLSSPSALHAEACAKKCAHLRLQAHFLSPQAHGLLPGPPSCVALSFCLLPLSPALCSSSSPQAHSTDWGSPQPPTVPCRGPMAQIPNEANCQQFQVLQP